MRFFLELIANFLGVLWNVLPNFLRRGFLIFFLILESRHQRVDKGLKNILFVRDKLDWVTNERAMKFGKGVHPKHYLTKYHEFFIENINDGERVLDIGCGYGAVAKSVAKAKPQSVITGVDLDKGRLSQAKRDNQLQNLDFYFGDATQSVPDGNWDVVILSNVLEHLNDRPVFLRNINKTTGAKRFLIRVPLFERDWQMALRRDLSVDFRSDDDHKIEHTVAEFRDEIALAEMKITNMQTLWGEIWAVCVWNSDPLN